MRDNTKSGALTEVTFYILLSLYTPRHGYAVMQFIEDKTKGQLLLGAGTLYGALTSLEKKVGSRPMAIWKKEKRILHNTSGKRNCRKRACEAS